MSETEQRVIDRCEFMGESAVRAGFIAGDFGDAPSHPDWRVAKAWLDAKDSNKRDAREIETLSIAKEANAIARSASRWAMWASIIAVIAIVSEIKDQISSLIP